MTGVEAKIQYELLLEPKHIQGMDDSDRPDTRHHDAIYGLAIFSSGKRPWTEFAMLHRLTSLLSPWLQSMAVYYQYVSLAAVYSVHIY